jgi:beta-lactamase regulating signal transducer with metallopeptidase domain
MTEDLLAACIPVLGRALLNFVWQGGVIGLIAAFALFALRHALPQTRYAVACTALLACLLAPLIDIVMQLGMFPAKAVAPAAQPAMFWIATATAAAPATVEAWGSTADAWLPTVVAMWAAGACVFCLRMALGVAWIQRLRDAAQPPAQAQWQTRLDALVARFGLKRPVALCLVDGIDSPASAGWWRPVVLLPASLLTRMPVELIEALLAHELAHVRRHDYLVNLLQGLVEALLFYHPVVWWLSRQVRIEREHVADRLAADTTGNPHGLAVALAELSELRSARSAPPRLAQAAHGGHLMSRIEQLVRPGRRTAGRIAFPLLGVAAACVAFYAHAQINGDAPARTDTSAQTLATPAPAPVVEPVPLPQPAPNVQRVLDMPSAPQAPAVAWAAAGAAAGAAADADVDIDPGDIHVDAGEIDIGHIDIDGDDEEAYALVRRDRGGITMSGSSRDIERVKALRNNVGGDFLWFRHDGRAYTVTDPNLVARAGRAWQQSEAVGKQMKALGHEMEAHGERMNALGREMGKLGPRSIPTPAMLEAQQRIGKLAGRQGTLVAQQAQFAARIAARGHVDEPRMEREMEAMEARLDAEMEALEAQIDREVEKIEAEAERMAHDNEAFGRRMEEAAKPMEALGERMGDLGERQERLATQADREVRTLIEEALDRGLAKPAPGTSAR